MTSPVSVSVADNGVAVVTVDYPPVNALGRAVREGLWRAVDEVEAAGADAAVLACAGRTFHAGADIREFDQAPTPPILGDLIDKIEGSAVPWVAAMHGTALGGGLEIALGCRYRVAAPGARMGLPEVHLGLLPGAGGTQRLPRIVGAETAVRMVTTGAPIGAKEALRLGIVDEIAEGDLTEAAVAFAARIAHDARPAPSHAPISGGPSEDEWDAMHDEVEKRAKGQTSPLVGFSHVRNAFRAPLHEGLMLEREAFLECKATAQSDALRYAFFAERAVAKPAVIKGVEPGEVKRLAVIGGGLMGSGIATSALGAGLTVVMVEADATAAEAGAGRVAANLDSAVRRGKMTEAKRDETLARLTATADYAATADCDMAIEAVFEDLDVKRGVFAKLDAAMKPDAIIATNTSYIDPNKIAEGVSNQGRIVGTHFFSPAHIMRLCEVVKADATTPETLSTVFALAKRMGKVAALSGVCEGFIGNRILGSYLRVTGYMAEDMRDIRAVDDAMRAFGLPMGPFELGDLAGLQIGWATRKRLAPTRDPAQRYSVVADRLCEAGRFGQKTGAGYYRYEKGDRRPHQDPFTAEVLAEAAGDRPVRQYDEEEIQRRALAVMVNEGAKILAEGIAARPLDIDMVKLFGYGFPRWRGGPMKYADQEGCADLLKVMRQVAADDPGSWTISPLFDEVAAKGGFAPLNG